jgi:hypothetical protein
MVVRRLSITCSRRDPTTHDRSECERGPANGHTTDVRGEKGGTLDEEELLLGAHRRLVDGHVVEGIDVVIGCETAKNGVDERHELVLVGRRRSGETLLIVNVCIDEACEVLEMVFVVREEERVGRGDVDETLGDGL